MIARIQATIVVALCGLLALCAWRAFRSHNWVWCFAPLLLIGFTHFLALVFELALQRSISRRHDGTLLALVPLLRAALREQAVALRVFCWQQPFRSRAHRNQLTSSRPIRGLVLIHGFYCNRGVWNRWMDALQARGIPFVAVNLEPVYGAIDDYAAAIEQAVQRVTAATGRPPVIVGHSMGGLAARAWVDARDAELRVERIVTIGSPHHGTVLSRFSRAANAHQMCRGSEWLSALAAREPPHRAGQFTCFHSDYDNVIIPASSARLVGADNRRVNPRSHLALLDAPEIFMEVLRLVER